MDLPVYIWLDATIKSLNIMTISTYLRHRGDNDRGLVALIIDHLDGTATAYIQCRDFNTGNLLWNQVHKQPVLNTDMEQWIQKQLQFDGDMWILEIECPNDTLLERVFSVMPSV